MSGGDDWKPGDLALCVNARVLHDLDGATCLGSYLKAGAIYTVDRAGRNRAGRLALWLCEIHCAEPWGKRADRFRKINPLTDEERDEFLADLNVPVREVLPLSSAGDAA